MTTDFICPACGTVYRLPANGPPFCPNNNCPRHSSLVPGASTLRAAATEAMAEVDAWDIAVKQAEQALAGAKKSAEEARARVASSLAAAEKQAVDELAEIKALRPQP